MDRRLGSVVTDEGSKPEILTSIAQTTVALASLKSVCSDRSISLSSKIRLMCSLVTCTFLYACESWTLTAELQRRIQAMKMRCYRKILRMSHKDHVTNEVVRSKIQQTFGPYEDLKTIAKRCKLKWYGHVSRSSGLAKIILQGTVNGGRRQETEEEVGKQHQGMDRPRVCQVPEGSGEQRKLEETCCELICGAPMTPAVKA